MANGHGGKRPGAGRKAQPKAPTIPATPKRKSRALAMALDIIRQSHALANRQRRDPKLNPFQLPAFPPAAVPQEKKLQMAMDNSMTWAGAAWAASTIEGTADAGLLFPGYPFLSLLAQRQEYRLVSETIADDATRKWIDFEVTGEKRQGEKEAEERQRQSRIAQQQLPTGDEAPMMTPPPAGGAAVGRTFEDPDPDERRKRIERAGKADKVKAIKDEMLRLEARDRYYCVSRDDGFFGRSHLYMNFGTDIDGDAPDELRTPIGDGRDATSRGKVNKGRPLQSLRVIEPVWTYPTTYNAVNPMREDWYSPQVWYVLGKEIHRSRLPTFIGHPVPDLLKPAYSFGGISMSQLVKPYVDIWLTTRSSVGQLIHSFSVMVLLTDMQTILQPTGDEGDEGFPVPNVGGLLARVAEFNALRDNQNTFVLNKDTEDFKNVSASLAGLHELQAQSLEHIASCSRIPLVKLTGISPSGLNASSEGEIRAYYDTIAAYQNRFFRPNLTKLINFVQLSLFDEIDPEITFEFEPLWEMSEVERAELQQKEAETSKTYVDMGAIGNDEVRQVIIDDPKLPFVDLDPDEVPELRAEEEGGLIPEGGGRAVEPLLEAGPGVGSAPAQENTTSDPAFDQAPLTMPDAAYFDAMSEEQLMRLLAANDNELVKILSSG